MKKFLNFCKKNSYFLYLIIPFFLICIKNVRPDNDIWFLLGNGRYIFEHGIPHVDPFSIHEGLDYIMQQWLTSAFLWKIYVWFGKRAILTFVLLMSIALIGVYYKLCYTISNNKKLSVLICALIFLPMKYFLVSRPQIITYLILVLELLLLELYIKKDNAKYLILLPFLSLLEINLHSTMWGFMFIVLIPYFLNCINIKNLTVDKVRWKPLVIVTICMIACGLINPYGYKNMLVIVNSYGSSSINKCINEMKSLNFDSLSGKIMILSTISYIGLSVFFKHKKLDIRHTCILCGFTLLAFMHNKGFAYFLLALGFALAYQFGDFDIDKLEKKVLKKFTNNFQYIMMSICFFLLISFGYCLFLNYSYYAWNTFTSHDKVADYIEENYDLNEVRLFTKFDNGGYFEYRGIKCYIDGRAELFLKKFNHKEEIMDEYYEIFAERLYDYESFLNKYHFTHLFVDTDSDFHDYLMESDDYEVVYNDWFDDEKTFAIRKLFAYVGDNKEK